MENKKPTKERFELKLTKEEKQKLKVAALLKGLPANKYVMQLVEKDMKGE